MKPGCALLPLASWRAACAWLAVARGGHPAKPGRPGVGWGTGLGIIGFVFLFLLTRTTAQDVPFEGELAYLRTPSAPHPGLPGEREPTGNLAEGGRGNATAERSVLTGEWAGWRPALARNGFIPGIISVVDGSSGHTDNGHRVWEGLLDLNLNLDTEPSLGISGGTAFVQYFAYHSSGGGGGVGELQAVSNIASDRRGTLGEAWYEQKFLGDNLRFKVGQIDANAESAFVEGAADFINSSAGVSPTLLGLPTYPDAAVGLSSFIRPVGSLYVGAAVFTDNVRRLTRSSFRRPYLLAELGFMSSSNEKLTPSKIAVGTWRVGREIDRLDGGTEKGASGYYVVAEQLAWKERPADAKDTQGVTLFAQGGEANAHVSVVTRHLGLGASAVGLFRGRDADSTGFYWSWARTGRFEGEAVDGSETCLEFYHDVHLTPFFSVKPDFQWIRHPGGRSLSSPATVATLRVTLVF